MIKLSNPGTVLLITMGCAKNRVDSEHILKQLSARGISIVSEEEKLYEGEVDTFIVNTCGFIKDAKQESIEMIFRGIKAKMEGKISHLIVFGCLSQRYKTELEEMMPEVDAFFGAFDVESILKLFSLEIDNSLMNQRLLTTPSHYAYLKISEGCDRTCSYCAIPMIRGGHKSIPIEDLIEEATFLASIGVKELIVVAQDTTYYGLDIYGKRSLARLLSELEKIEGIEWIRLLYSYPASFPKDVLEIIAASNKICKYLDIPLQHSSDKVLAAMRRSIDGEQTRALIKSIREIVPDITLRTTMIVGHPGEGKREFNQLLDFIREFRFERLGAFTYSPEEGTYGAKNYKNRISEREKQERYNILMEAQSEISASFNQSRVGKSERVIIEGSESGFLTARSMKESPEVDGLIYIEESGGFDKMKDFGIFAQAKIVRSDQYDLYAIIERH